MVNFPTAPGLHDFQPPEINFYAWQSVTGSAGKGAIEAQRRTAVAALRAITAYSQDVEIQRLPTYSNRPLIEGSTNPTGFFMPGQLL